MPSPSESQRRLFGMVTAYKEGKLKNASPKIKNVSKHISAQSALDFARKTISERKAPVKKRPKKDWAYASSRRDIAKSLI